MSSIFLCVGQCGNQLAKSLFDLIELNESNQSAFLYKHFDGKYRSIHIDSETKVINSLTQSHGKRIRKENLINTKCGRGSNFATGYTGLSKDNKVDLVSKTLESLRKEAENCDLLLSMNMLHSLSGGTGSGFGSKLIESIRDIYGYKKYVFTCSVAPFKDGELPLQHYNNLLCMSHLHEHADCVFLFRNDETFALVEKQCAEMNQQSKSIDLSVQFAASPPKSANISVEDLNAQMVRAFYSSIAPVDSLYGKSQGFGLEQLEIKRLCCSYENLKIVELFHFSETSRGYFQKKMQNNAFIKELNKYFKRSCVINDPLTNSPRLNVYKTLNSVVILRGSEICDNSTYFYKNETEFKKMLNCVAWNPYPIDYLSNRKSLIFSAKESSKSSLQTSSVTLALNRNSCVDFLEDIRNKSRMKFQSNAYLHWYSKYGIEKEFFENSFNNIDFIIDSYKEMCA